MYDVTTLSPASNLNFGKSVKVKQDYIPELDYDLPEDDFARVQTRADIERERDEKLAEIRKTQDGFNELAASIEENGGDNKVTKGLSKTAKVAASLVGLAATYTTAKLGSKVTINILKDLAKSPTMKSGIDAVKSGIGKISKVKDSKFAQSAINSIKNSQVGKKVAEIAQKPAVKNAMELASGAKKSASAFVKKHLTADKIQTAIENTLAASTTASVLIDDLAGRNDNRSAMELAMGASGGDK